VTPPLPDVTVVGHRLGTEDHRLRDFFTRVAQPFEWIDGDTPAAGEVLARHGATGAPLPVVVQGSGFVSDATVERVVEAWQLRSPPRRLDYDLLIIGAGPAGLAAAVYAASDGLSTLLVDRDVPGGQASHTSMIENFFGFPEGIGGAELARLAGRQAEKFGAELVLLRGVTGHRVEPDGSYSVFLEGDVEVRPRTMIVAPGMVWRRLEVDGIEELLGRGVYYGAGRSEAAQCGGESVVVVGAGNSAGQAVMNLAGAGARVTMLVRGADLGKSMSGYLVDRIAAHSAVDVRLRSELAAIEADDDGLEGVMVQTRDGARTRVQCSTLFLCLGGIPRSGWAQDSGVRLDEAGFILTGPDLLVDGRRPDGWPLSRDPLVLETSVPGIFAAGDVRHGSAKRVAGAVGDGATAVALAHRRLEELLG
jgi:thioredoxin reductase (NADPH)